MGIEITTLRFPTIDRQDEQVALQLAETNLAIEASRHILAKKEMSKLNQATHIRLQEDRDREAEAEERKQQVEHRSRKILLHRFQVTCLGFMTSLSL